MLALVIVSYIGYDAPVLSGVMEGFPAQEQGMQAGDTITEVNGHKVRVYRDVQLELFKNQDRPVTVEYTREGESGTETQTAVLTPEYSEENQAYMLGIQVSPYRTPTASVGETIKYSLYEVQYVIKSVVKSLAMIFQGDVGREDVDAPSAWSASLMKQWK